MRIINQDPSASLLQRAAARRGALLPTFWPFIPLLFSSQASIMALMRLAVRACASFLAIMPFAVARDSPLIGDWIGTLEAPGQKLRLALHVSQVPNGALRATFDSLDQHASGIPVDDLRLDLNMVRFSLRQAGATFQGKLI